jgi:hypothetical protein
MLRYGLGQSSSSNKKFAEVLRSNKLLALISASAELLSYIMSTGTKHTATAQPTPPQDKFKGIHYVQYYVMLPAARHP